MFDDPKKELSRLDAELRAESYEEQLEKLQSQEIPDLDELFENDDDGWLPGAEEAFSEEEDIPYARNPRGGAADFRRTIYADETTRESEAVFVEKQKKEKKEKKTKESVGCLPFIIFLELLGIGGMLWWWYRWMR